MTFKIIIQQNPISIDFEVGSLSEAVAALQEEDAQIRKIGAIAAELSGAAAPEAASGEDKGATGEPAKRGRKAKNQPDPATAQAPPPAPIPAAAPAAPAPNLAPAADGGIPPFLQRTETPAAAAPPPPPPPPAAPPSGVLAGKIIANLDQRKAGSADGGKVLADWLAQSGVVVPGSSYDDAIAALRLTPDDKLGTIAKALEVA